MKRILLLVIMATSLFAVDNKNPASKAYIADAEGDATVRVQDGHIQETKKREVYDAQGLVFETKAKANQSMVLSNGSGVYMDETSHLEIKKFVQEPFQPNRTDMDIEPSISQTTGIIPHGYIAICTPKIVAGSNMTYQSPHGAVKLFNNKTTIDVGDSKTTIISVEGEATIQVGPNTSERIKVGEKATIDGKTIRIEKASKKELEQATDKTAIACHAKKEVYFDVVDRIETGQEIKAIPVLPIKLPTQFTVSPARID